LKLQIFTPYKYVWDFTVKAAYYLGIDNKNIDLVITIRKELDDGVYGYCHGEGNNIEIELARNVFGEKLTRETILQTLAHEMVHAKQYAKKELKRVRADTVVWKNKKVEWSDEIEDCPWEVEAYSLENEVYKHCQ